ncbi:Hypothetical predicted protein [Lecanosticta acicola]|uniref:Uncharacterized protein n=1 Tax=Lecanosticta acicola TaxID=111012 RepID=A0AAI8Z4D6_9PEZI|nr:Hypothetical predicted protein [Lecanosticta acicola]
MDPRQQRQQQHQQQQPRPSYLHIQTQSPSSSSTSSVFQSTSSLASLSSINQPQSSQMPESSAPLPSPAVNQPMSYFGSIASQPTTTSHPAQQQRAPAQAQQAAGSHYVGQRGDGGGVPETAPFLQDFNLVAEAAKRAQMACLSRDLGDIGL